MHAVQCKLTCSLYTYACYACSIVQSRHILTHAVHAVCINAVHDGLAIVYRHNILVLCKLLAIRRILNVHVECQQATSSGEDIVKY